MNSQIPLLVYNDVIYLATEDVVNYCKQLTIWREFSVSSAACYVFTDAAKLGRPSHR